MDATHESLAAHPEHGEHHGPGPNTVFGFWLYLMTDCILFATLFAAFAVARHQFADGPSGHDIFDLKYVGVETLLLLVSSCTYGLAMLDAYRNRTSGLVLWMGITFLLGLGFIGMEVNEFSHLVAEGHGPDQSAFLSAFFTLVGTHGLHVTCGLIWMVVLMSQILIKKNGISGPYMNRLMCLSLFWHFLDIVWICVFTFVYLMGVQ
ncbi:cytochrome o ubiquinol oxidase subunit III [Lichenicoccus roseus]|uniref:Cytochrome bo(3) ubiquinol oxidase subunit 3 n=1 Tax=Lichenicoccus roseus TaxID=2683649 RepID=A0A5R9JHK0_9PROT|nr:cytochrome o ubiquinol oxidase subunit III [Lichenicoccus roseus]TLU73788.1 cytochrome o ubiquinol oxidase subunit III [Lichenicoccus roseus]